MSTFLGLLSIGASAAGEESFTSALTGGEILSGGLTAAQGLFNIGQVGSDNAAIDLANDRALFQGFVQSQEEQLTARMRALNLQEESTDAGQQAIAAAASRGNLQNVSGIVTKKVNDSKQLQQLELETGRQRALSAQLAAFQSQQSGSSLAPSFLGLAGSAVQFERDRRDRRT